MLNVKVQSSWAGGEKKQAVEEGEEKEKEKERKEKRRGNLTRSPSFHAIFTEIIQDHTLKTFSFQNEDNFENEIS